MKLINANKLFNEIADNEEIAGPEKIKILKAISEQPAALSIVDLIIQIGNLDVVGVKGEVFVNFKDVLKVINGGRQDERD